MKLYKFPFLLFFFIFILSLSVFANQTSNVFTKNVLRILNQAEQVYIVPRGKNTHFYFTKDPTNYATILGLTFQRQIVYAKQTSKYKREINLIGKEMHSYLNYLAKVHYYKNPRDGKPMAGKLLINRFHYAATGKLNTWVIKNWRIDPRKTQLAMILDKVENNNTLGGDSYEEDAPGGIPY